jgi:hypothetical protein
MQVVTRFRVDAGEASSFLRNAQSVLTVLGNCISWRSGHLGHVVDDPKLWVRTASAMTSDATGVLSRRLRSRCR